MNLKLVVKYKVPSLNRLFAMNHWQRAKERRKAHVALMYALMRTGHGSSILTTSARNRLLMGYGTLVSYLATGHKTSNSRSHKRSVTSRTSGRRSS